MKCTDCQTSLGRHIYFELEHEAWEIVRLGGGRTYFYKAHDWDNGYDVVKIGSTNGDPHARVAAFGRGKGGIVAPDGVDVRNGDLIGVIIGGARVERALHAEFKDLRLKGEWFILTEELDLLIEQLIEEWCAEPGCCDEVDAELQAAQDALLRQAINRHNEHFSGFLNWWANDKKSDEVAS